VRDYSLRGELGSTRLHHEFDREFHSSLRALTALRALGRIC